MNWNRTIRQIHRWTSLVFTVVVAGIFLALGLGEPAEWVYLLPLAPLLLLLLTGLYLFALPHAASLRGGGRSAPVR
jgi:ABC-type polysaccharide/polyol phosphate export permease